MKGRHLTNEENEFNSAVIEEFLRAKNNWPDWHSAHEGYGVMLEEFDELWEHVKVKQKNRDYDAMGKECVQIAAMAMRMFFDCCHPGGGGYKK